ncbi:MAG: presenilin family intramembrane aspartyl protease [Candidatus Micrarchaeota archaeon]
MKDLILRLLAMFVLAQIIGTYTGVILLSDMKENPFVQAFVITEKPQDLLNAVYFVAYALAGAAFLMFVIRFVRSELFFRLMEFALISTASSLVFYSLLRIWLPYGESMTLGILLALALATLKFFVQSIKNIAAILATAGAGAIFGSSFSLPVAVLFLILLSVYDYIAVLKTKHMVEMAKFMIQKELAFTVTSRKYVPEVKKEARIDLGTGDLIAPIIVEVAAFSINPLISVVVGFGALVSLGLFLFLVWRKGLVLPALPPITAGVIVSLLVSMLLGLW